ncbi:hypothetical protein SAMN05443144_103116 [Fodinibius roseus]|uniref:DUF4296 domain-containing protein n=1 Tax=Fodinibius roseus TaxID=1194090 RepID=A0A1M4W4I9_9BACT|nr:hypothetical protein [Fodinibius roseus]SHE76023.1 hypothetical protein SAMN05443144_103116 [Fodinibius roseus]
MKYAYTVIIGGLLLFTACKDPSEKSEIAKDSTAAATKKDSSTYLKPGFDYVTQVPDSLKTPEQKKLAKQLLEISIEHIKVVDNRMVFDMSRDEFLKTSIPIEYYDLFKKDMKNNNRYIKEQSIKNVDEMIEEYRRNTREVLKEKY